VSFTLVMLPDEDYPALPELTHLAGTADGGELATAIGQVTPAASKDDTLPMLTSVSLALAAETMTLAATDRYRMAVRDLPWKPGDAVERETSVLVPARVLAEAGRMMSGGRDVRILLGDGVDEAMIGFECGERRLTTRLMAGEFIKYRSRFPAEFGCVADLPAEAFAEAVRRVSLVAERGTPVQLSFGAQRVTVVAATQGQARARESVPAEFSGDEPVIAFNPHYLLDGIVAATARPGSHGAPAHEGEDVEGHRAARVRIQFTTPSKPAVITRSPVPADAGVDFRYLVVPQRVAH